MALTRRHFLRGLVAAPAVVAAQRLMPLRGVVQPVGYAAEFMAELAEWPPGGLPDDWPLDPVPWPWVEYDRLLREQAQRIADAIILGDGNVYDRSLRAFQGVLR